MLEASISFANGLKEIGLKKGDNILVLAQKHHYVAPVMLGCVFAGVVFCPFFYTDTSVKAEICDLVSVINPKMMITSYVDLVEEFHGIFRQTGVNCPIYVYETHVPGCLDLKALLCDYVTPIKEFRPSGVTDPARELFVINLSSATTSKPKLINMTHKQMLMQS